MKKTKMTEKEVTEKYYAAHAALAKRAAKIRAKLKKLLDETKDFSKEATRLNKYGHKLYAYDKSNDRPMPKTVKLTNAQDQLLFWEDLADDIRYCIRDC